MKSTFFATAALVAATAADAIGNAIVINKCNYDVYLFNVPSANGGYSETDKVLATNGTYEQQFTQLSNGNGWSIKLSKSTNLDTILQYEYTFHNDGTIWYDLSAVNGNPWDSNWEISSDSATCVPRQAAYRYATDDAYGMQSCPDSSTLTVTLCSGESQNDGAAASISSSAAANSVSATSATSATATATSTKASTTLKTSTVTSATASSASATTTTTRTHRWGPSAKRDAHHHAARHPHARE